MWCVPTRQNHIKVPTYYTTLLLYAQTKEIETCNNNYVDILLKFSGKTFILQEPVIRVDFMKNTGKGKETLSSFHPSGPAQEHETYVTFACSLISRKG